MKIKPTQEHPVKVYDVVNVWRGIWAVTWSDLTNYPRCFTSLYRRLSDGWYSGEAFPTGCYSNPLRQAHPIVAQAIEQESARRINQ